MNVDLFNRLYELYVTKYSYTDLLEMKAELEKRNTVQELVNSVEYHAIVDAMGMKGMSVKVSS